MKLSTFTGLSFVTLLAAASASAAEIPLTTTRVASGLTRPLFVTSPPGDTGRLFIVEQGLTGTALIKILDLSTNTVLATPFLTVAVDNNFNERGLLGLAFHPDYAVNGYFYVYLSDTPSSNVLRRYTVSANPDIADATSAQTVLVSPEPGNPNTYWNHNGGWIAFGPDNYLYVASGDGGSANDPLGNGQNINVLLGKMLRIDVDGDDFPADPNANYAIPPSNPFAGAIPGRDEIWHYGLRNPWRDSFDRATGDLYIGDVGQDAVEEVSFQPAGMGGLNYGWRCMEGGACTGLSGCTCNGATLTNPIRTYTHSSGCSVTGGYVYRGTALCGMQGTYFYADYCPPHKIWSFRYVGGIVTAFTDRTVQLDPAGPLAISSITSFGEDASGELYICDRGGEVFKIVPGALVDCNANAVQDACDIESGTSTDANGDGIPDECQPIVTAFCFGDGGVAPCPCANNGGPGRGCENSSSTGGALLAYAGSAMLSADSFELDVSDEKPTALSIFLQGTTEVAPAIYGDGLRCTGGTLKRLYAKNASGGFVSAPTGADPSVSARSASLGDSIAPGETRRYQVYYRDPSGTFCPDPPGNTWNVSGGLRVTWSF